MTTRRNFLRAGGMAAAGLALGGFNKTTSSMSAASYSRIMGANEKVRLACVGVGNQGGSDVMSFFRTGLCDIVALCDVDMGARQTQRVTAQFPNAKQFKDFREMFDKIGNEFDAVSAGVPDFAHFPVAMLSLASGKHVFVEKPMARTFYEAELMMQAARKHPKLATQVGNQGHSEANYFQFKAWVDAGIIKDVTAITAHMNSDRRWHPWDSNMSRYPEGQPIPETLDWDLWHMAIDRYHEFNGMYHPGNWRGWFDFGMGALGDWGAHILDTAHEFLELGLPEEVIPTYIEGHNDYIFPKASTLLFKFPKRKNMPAVDVTWYDGVKNLPPIPEGYGNVAIDPNIPPVNGGQLRPSTLNPGKIIYSKTLTFKGGTHGSTLSIIPEEKAKEMASKLPQVPESPSNHYANFLLGCQGKEKTRSSFETFGEMSQMFSLGVMAQRLNIPLKIDRTTKQITNNQFANAWLTQEPPRKGWEDFYKV